MTEYGESLSERELEILELVATGATNKEVAHQLHISTNTVKVHLRNIYTKMGAGSRTEATMIALREGWVVVPEIDVPSEAAEEEPEPPLPWRHRILLLLAALLAVGAVVLSWPRATPIASGPAGLLPEEGVSGPGRPLDTGEESHWMERAQMPTRRVWLGVAAWDRRLYAIGGRGPEGVTGAVEIYDPASDTWSRGSGKPTPVARVRAATLEDRILVPGGCVGDEEALDVLEVYDPALDAWEDAAPLPHPICAYALAVYDGRLYLFGGTDGETYLAETYVYDPEEDRWEERAPMEEPRALAAAAPLEDQIYVVGGYRAGRELASCSVYDPASDSWEDCPPLTMARGGHGLLPLGGRLYALGGGGLGGYLGFNERYDPRRKHWTAVETPLTGGWQGAGFALMDLTIYAVGGYSEDYLSLTFAFEPLPFRIFIPTAGEQ